MANLTIEIRLDNAAFADGNEAPEVARILEVLASKYREAGRTYNTLFFDINGNRVGSAEREE